MVSSWCAMLERRLAMPVDPVAERDDDGTADGERPGGAHEQAVGPGVISEIEWAESRNSGRDGHRFDAEQHEQRPDEVDELAGHEPRAERHRWQRALGGEGDAVVADEHQVPSSDLLRSSCTGLSPSQMRSSAR